MRRTWGHQNRPRNSVRNGFKSELGSRAGGELSSTGRYGHRGPAPLLRLDPELVLLLRLHFCVTACSIGFFSGSAQTAVMYPGSLARTARRFLRRGLSLGAALLLTSLSLLADTSGLRRSTPAGVCYCHCATGRSHGGCAKMCESKRYASRWWATSCARPHRKPAGENPGASPRLPHPDRAEHARL